MEIETLKIKGQCSTALKLYRKRAKLSQLELEIMADLSFGTICRIENGKTNPSKETLIKISSVLSLKPLEILNLLGVKEKV